MKTAAEYIAEAKTRLGDERMSDKVLGEELGRLYKGKPFAQQDISRAKFGVMTDPIAITVAQVLGEEPGLLLWVARTEREKDEATRRYLERWGDIVGKALARAMATAVVALGLLAQPPEAQAAGIGGDGGF